MKALEDLPLDLKIDKDAEGVINKLIRPGVYQIPHFWQKRHFLFCKLAIEDGWERLAIHLTHVQSRKTMMVQKVARSLTHEELALVKDLFWRPEEVTVIFQPAGTHYIANLEFVSFIWRPIELPLPIPPIVLAGLMPTNKTV